jgi:hypothetical protein
MKRMLVIALLTIAATSIAAGQVKNANATANVKRQGRWQVVAFQATRIAVQ